MAAVFIIDGATTVGAPNSGDSLYVIGGNATITTAVDQSALANGLVAVEVPFAYSGQFGTAANPFYTEVTSYIWYGAVSGSFFYKGKDTTDATPTAYFTGGGTFNFVSDGTITTGNLLSGTLNCAGPCILTNLYVAGGTGIILDDTSTDPTLLRMVGGPSGTGGTVYTERGGTTFTIECGKITIAAGSNTITTLNCTGPRSVTETILKESGTITTINALGHIPDTRQLSRPVTITNTNINVSLPGAQAFLDHPLITFTNTPTRFITDGRNL